MKKSGTQSNDSFTGDKKPVNVNDIGLDDSETIKGAASRTTDKDSGQDKMELKQPAKLPEKVEDPKKRSCI